MTPFNRENYGWFVSPALQIAAVDFINPDSGETIGRFRITHATTPIDGTGMDYFYVLARDHGNSPEEMEGLLVGSKHGFGEDETMIEAVQATISRAPRCTAAPEISVKADGPGIRARHMLECWMERETA